MDINNILVPIDFSECSKKALKVAIRLAKEWGSKIHMINAVHIHVPHSDIGAGTFIEPIIADYEEQVQNSFQELEKEIIELKDVPHDSEKFVSYLTDAIYSASKETDADLIVMGTRANHEKIDHLLGTHSTDVIGFSEIPVLVVPGNLDAFYPKIIGFASEFEEVHEIGRLDIIHKLAKTFGAKLLVFSVVKHLITNEHFEGSRIAKSINEKFPGVDCVFYTEKDDQVIHGIMDFIDEHDLDMLVLMPKKHSLFERIFKKSVSKNIAIDIKIPLLTFHDY